MISRYFNEKDWIIELYKDPDGANTLIQRGFIIPFQYQEPWEAAPYAVNLTATDGLADLVDRKFLTNQDDETSVITGGNDIISILTFCLSQTGLQQNLRCGFNMYEVSQNKTASDDPLKQAYQDQESYLGDSCRGVIEKICKGLGARLYSAGGYWYLEEITQKTASYNYREFDTNGDYVSNSSISPIIDFGQATDTSRLVLVKGSNTLKFDNVYKTINIIENRDVVDNLTTDFNDQSLVNTPESTFTGWTNSLNGDAGYWRAEGLKDGHYNLSFIILSTGGGNAYTSYGGNIEYKASDSLQIKFKTFYDYYGSTIKQAVSELAPLYVKQKWLLKVGNDYLKTDGTWTTTETINTYHLSEFNKDVEIDIGAFFDSDVTTNTSTTYELRIYGINIYEGDSSLTDASTATIKLTLTAIDASNFIQGHRWIVRNDVSSTSSTFLYYYELRYSDDTPSGLNIVASSEAAYLWYFVGGIELQEPALSTDRNYIREPSFLTFPDGQGIPETATGTKSNPKEYVSTITGSNSKTLDYELDLFDLDTTINNSENLILNYIKDAPNGNPTTLWGYNPYDKKIQKQLSIKLGEQYKNPANIITFKGISDIDVYFYNVLRDTNDDNKIYQFNKLTTDFKNMNHSGEITEIGSDTSTSLKAFKDNSFSSGFS